MEDLAVTTALNQIRVLLERISLSLRKKNKTSVLSTVFPNKDLPVGE